MGRRVQGASGAANLANDEHAHQPLAGLREIQIPEGVLSSADQRGLRCEFTTPTINVHAGWSQRITKMRRHGEDGKQPAELKRKSGKIC